MFNIVANQVSHPLVPSHYKKVVKSRANGAYLDNWQIRWLLTAADMEQDEGQYHLVNWLCCLQVSYTSSWFL